jgi:hypothetical protein
MEKIKEFIQNNYKLNLDNIRSYFLGLSLLSAFYFFPLFTSDIFLYNDFEVALTNKTSEATCGRYFADWLFSVLSFDLVGFSIVNTSPLNQILSLILLIFTVSVFFEHLLRVKPDWQIKLLAFTLIASPYLLRNFSWRLLGMMSIVSLSLALLASLQCKNRIVNIISGSILVFLSIGFFQTGVNVFLAASFFLFLIRFKEDNDEATKLLIDNFLKLVFGFIIYKVIFDLTIQNMNEYCESIASTFSLDDPFIKYTASQFKNIIDSISYSFFSLNITKFLTIISLGAFAIHYVLINDDSLQKKIKYFFVVLVSYSGLIFSQAGCLILLRHTLNEPRHFMAFSVFLAFIFYAFYTIFAKKNILLKIVFVILVGFFFLTSYSYSASFRSQDKYNNTVALLVKNTLLDYDFRPNHRLSFDGYIGYSPSNRNTMKKHKLLEGIMFYQLGNNWFSSLYMRSMGLEANYEYSNDTEEFKKACSGKTLYGNAYFRISKVGEYYLVAFREGECFSKIN